MPPADAGGRPRLAPGVRLHFDNTRQQWVLLAPERIIEMDGPVRDIVDRCDGNRTVGQIVQELAAIYDAPIQDIATDVDELLQELSSRRLILL